MIQVFEPFSIWKWKNLSYWIIHVQVFPDELRMISYNPGIKVEGRARGHIIYSQLTHQITEANTLYIIKYNYG